MPNGLIAHTQAFAPTGGGTTAGIDTTGANLLFVHGASWGNQSSMSITDNKGNTWTQLSRLLSSTAPNSNSAGAIYYVNSQTPNVGPGHTISFTNDYSGVQFTAFNSSTPWTLNTYTGSYEAIPGSTDAIASTQDGELFIACATSESGYSLNSIIGGFSLIDSQAWATYFGGSIAYKVDSTGSPSVDPTWSNLAGVTGASVLHLVAFNGTWEDLRPSPAGVSGLVVSQEIYGGANSSNLVTGVDTTGANLLVAHITRFSGFTLPGLTDNKGNVWTRVGQRGDNNNDGAAGGSAGTSDSLIYFVDSKTPNVGPGHTLSWTGSGVYGSVQFAAFASTTGKWSRDETTGIGGNYPLTLPAITPNETNELFFTGTASLGALWTISDSFTIIGSHPYTAGVNIGASFAYKIVSSSGTAITPIWSSGTSPGATTLAAFKGDWVPSATGAAGAGAASGLGSAAGTSRTDARLAGSAAGTGSASGIGRSSSASDGVSSAASLAGAAGRTDAISAAASSAIGAAIGASAAGLDVYGAGLAVSATAAAAVSLVDTETVGSSAALSAAIAAGVTGLQGVAASAAAGLAAAASQSDVRSAASSAAIGAAIGASSADLHVSGAGLAAGIGAAGAGAYADFRALGSAASLSTASAVGAAGRSGAATAVATSTAVGIADIGSTTATAAATSNAAGVGRLDAGGAANTAAMGQAAAVGRADFVAAGNAIAASFARAVIRVVGQAASTSTALAAGSADVRRQGIAAGIGTAVAASASETYSVAISVSLGVAVSFSVEPGETTKRISLVGHMPVAVSLVGAKPATIQLTGHCEKPIALTGDMGV